ncbi:MAG: OmpA family protein [Flavobacteriaceae bacterium]
MNNAMKYILSLALLVLCFDMHGGVKATATINSESMGESVFSDKSPLSKGGAAEIEFLRLARKHKIPTRKLSGLKEVFEGYYLVAGAFGEQSNAKRFVGNLTSQGLKPKILFNPQNKLHYVYLEHHSKGIQAINSCISGLNEKYRDPIWILNVENSKVLPANPGQRSAADNAVSESVEEFRANSRKNGIANRVVRDLDGVANGYYLISGVFGEKANARKQLLKLRSLSLSPKILYNSKNGMNYVFLKHSEGWEEAITMCNNSLYGKFSGKMWILAVVNEDQKSVSRSDTKRNRSFNDDIKARTFYAMTAEKNIPTRSDPGFEGMNKGFYLVAGVYGNSENASAYLEKLRRKKLPAQLLIHPKSQLNYVYLKHYVDGGAAIEDYLSNMKGAYKDPMWILHVDPPGLETNENSPSAIQAKPENEDSDILKSYKRTNLSFHKSSQSPVYNDKLLEKADLYFDKMWYAEAAELYEMVLNENPENQTFEIIRKAGDAHYFNTNMERAYYWYDRLYAKYKSDMRAENLFKYAHSLKGTGKYGRAKRLMRLYNKALKAEGSSNRYRPRPGDAVLDNILNTEEQEININNVAVNSAYSDFSPMFYQDDKMVFASAMDSAFFNTRRYKWNDQPYLDLYVAKLNEQSNEVRDAVKFSKKINTKYHEASVTFSPDQQTIYFTRNNYGKKLKRDKKGVNNLKIYRSDKIGDTWSEAKELPFNSDEYSTGHPALSPDGTKLYFVSDMPGSMGKTDLFVVDVLGDGQFSEPRNLGPDINTERREMFPFISDEKLYFASDGHVGLGGLDIYEVSISEEGFSKPLNMGQPINSKRDDFSYIIKEETQKGFFASNRRGGKGDDDIYSFKRLIPEEPNENAIAGVVTEMITGEVMPKSLVELLDENNVKLMEVETGEDGSFVFEELESNTRYVVRTTQDTFIDDEQIVSTEENKRIEIEVKMNQLAERVVIEDGIRKLKIDMIYFDFDKFNIRNDAAEELDKLVEVLKTYPTMVIKVESHTDSRGKRAYNKYLSDKRAKSTREYLISKGIDPKRIESAIGYGEERLLNECNGTVRCSSAQHQLNRRSEFIIVNM